MGGQLFYCQDSIYGVAQVVGVQKNKVVFLDLGKKLAFIIGYVAYSMVIRLDTCSTFIQRKPCKFRTYKVCIVIL